MNEDLIRNLLIEYMERLHNDSQAFVNGLKPYESQFKSDRFRSAINEFKICMETFSKQISTHMKLDNTEITSCNFYKDFNSFFDSNRYHKEVDYYIQNGFGEEKILVNAPDVLEKEFNIPYCYKSMSVVPINIASNAKKYIPDGGHVTVLLTKEDTYKYITIINAGPKCEDSEIDTISEENIRGKNSDVIAGMGLGTSQIKTVIGMHKALIDTSFHMKSDKNAITINGTPYSQFTTSFSFNTILSENKLLEASDNFKSRISLIILHNMGEITSNILNATRNLRNSISFKGDYDWKRYANLQIVNTNRMQNIMKVCLFVKNEFKTNYLLGNACEVSAEQTIINNLDSLRKFCYNYKNISITYSGNLSSISSYSVVYPILFGLSDMILKSIPNESQLSVTFDADDDSISFYSEEADFSDLLNTEGDLTLDSPDGVQRVQKYLYKELFNELKFSCDFKDNEFILKF